MCRCMTSRFGDGGGTTRCGVSNALRHVTTGISIKNFFRCDQPVLRHLAPPLLLFTSNLCDAKSPLIVSKSKPAWSVTVGAGSLTSPPPSLPEFLADDLLTAASWWIVTGPFCFCSHRFTIPELIPSFRATRSTNVLNLALRVFEDGDDMSEDARNEKIT